MEENDEKLLEFEESKKKESFERSLRDIFWSMRTEIMFEEKMPFLNSYGSILVNLVETFVIFSPIC